MYRKRLALLFLLGYVGVAQLPAQQFEIDSLSRAVTTYIPNDTFKVRIISQLAFYYHFIYPDSTVALANRGYTLAIQLADESGQAENLKLIGVGYYVKSSYADAILYSSKALDLYQKLGDLKGQGAVLNNMANVYHKKGDLKHALQYHKLSLSIRELIRDEKGIASSYNNMGNVYSEMGNFSEALRFMFQSLAIREKDGDLYLVANSYANIAGIYMLLGNYEDAKKYTLRALVRHKITGAIDGIAQCASILGDICYYQQQYEKSKHYFYTAYDLALWMQDVKMIGMVESNLAKLCIKDNKLDSAGYYIKKALDSAYVYDDDESISRNLIQMGELLLLRNKLSEATAALLEGFRYATSIESKENLSEASLLLSNCYERQGRFDVALKYLKLNNAYKDSLYFDEVLRKSYAVEFEYKLAQQNDRIKLLEMDTFIHSEQVQKQWMVIVFLLSFVLLTLGSLYVVYHSRKKEREANILIRKQHAEIEIQAKSLHELNGLKDKIFSVLSHDLRSPVSSLIGMVNLLEEGVISQQEFIRLKTTFSDQLFALNHLLENLLIWSQNHMKSDMNPRKTMVHVYPMTQSILLLYKEIAAAKKIKLEQHTPEHISLHVDEDQLKIVLRNLVSNAIKFSHPDSVVQLTTQTNIHPLSDKSELRISVSDTGAGMSPEQLQTLFTSDLSHVSYGTAGEKGMGIGLQLCKEFIEKNGGRIEVKSEKGIGSTFTVVLPME